MRELFADRHIGTDAAAQKSMLAAVGYDSVESLVDAAVPGGIRVGELASILPPPASERATITELRALAARNTVNRSLIGLGYYDTITPAVIKRNVLENPSWYTAYTPYQPEISQGRLEALLNFQTMVAELTGMTTANASMLDEGTAVVEGMLLARRASGSTSNVFVVDADALPQTTALLRNRANALGIELSVVELAETEPAEIPESFGVFIQYPGASGRVWDPSAVIATTKERGGLSVVAADLLAVTLLASPGDLGADVAVGTSQRFGVPMGFGGPHAGYLAVRAGLERQLPGRLVGVSQDAVGNTAYRLALQAREQHIRREKATSNICTAQVLLAVMASMYAVYHGPAGLKRIAQRVHASAVLAAKELNARGVSVRSESYFDTLIVEVADAAALVTRAHEHGVLVHAASPTTVTLAFDEVAAEELDAVLPQLFEIFGVAGVERADAPGEGVFQPSESRWYALSPQTQHEYLPALARKSAYLQHPVFNTHRSETSMMRYLKYLADKDYALDRGMIPLGSCTMKLNAATEMEAVTWPEFAGLHPFAPESDSVGYRELIGQLESWLAEVTGYDAVSLQPNAGSQGELAGLLAIRGYHLANGDAQRTTCLIPSSAHGTNAASAMLAGMRVVVVDTDALGNVDLADLHAKIAEHRDDLAALMITYPSTHGVYEHEVRAITDAVHEAGGQVYIDGANLNALLGYARFGDFGGDVSHLNLHKTFCIPHGGGGPGVGPVAAKAHLAQYLPAAPGTSHFDDPHIVSAAKYGSPSILPISWAYVRMMGSDGLKAATGAAVLAANYIAVRLREHYPVLYAGDNGLVAHECILDLRPLKEATGIDNNDVAKRLIDYGFHAPTMSFPVPGTLMVEPTESEDLAELDRFIEAMIAIKAEADAVAAGTWPADDNPLVHAPHTAESVISGEWAHAYTREQAVYPLRSLVRNKYWPPVRRVDNAWGDRNLFCACPPPEAFE
jgi:glycine dehydrogenase